MDDYDDVVKYRIIDYFFGWRWLFCLFHPHL